jgi:hypothetical protein
MKFLHVIRIGVVLPILFLYGCFGDENDLFQPISDDTDMVEVWIDKSGGSVGIPARNAELFVPPNSIAMPSSVQMRLLASDELIPHDRLLPLGPAVSFGPHHMGFNVDNTPILTVPYDETMLVHNDLSPKNVRIFYYNEYLGKYVDLGGTVNEDGTISTPIHHFSTYVAMAYNLFTDESKQSVVIDDERVYLPIIGAPEFYPAPLLGLPFDIRFNIHDHTSAVTGDGENAIANVECYWEVIGRDGTVKSTGYKIHLPRYTSSNNTYQLRFDENNPNPITDMRDSLHLTVTARDNVGYVSTKTFVVKGTFRKPLRVESVNPTELFITGGFQAQVDCTVRNQFYHWDEDTNRWINNVSYDIIDPLYWEVIPNDPEVDPPTLGSFPDSVDVFLAKGAGDGNLKPYFEGVADRYLKPIPLHIHAGELDSIHILHNLGIGNSEIIDDDTFCVAQGETY